MKSDNCVAKNNNCNCNASVRARACLCTYIYAYVCVCVCKLQENANKVHNIYCLFLYVACLTSCLLRSYKFGFVFLPACKLNTHTSTHTHIDRHTHAHTQRKNQTTTTQKHSNTRPKLCTIVKEKR